MLPPALLVLLLLLPHLSGGLWLSDQVAKDTNLHRLAFGSCNKANKPQPFWKGIAARSPDAFVWLGDVVYADKKIMMGHIPVGAMEVPRAWREQAEHPEYAPFAAGVPVTGIYDDHDVGTNDADRHSVDEATFSAALTSLLDFLGEGKDSPRRVRNRGAYAAYEFSSLSSASSSSESSSIVKLILLDNRAFRDPYGERGGIDPASPLAQDMLGAAQWDWLEQELRGNPTSSSSSPRPSLTIIASSLQFIARGDPLLSESWSLLPQSQARLLSLLALTNTSAVILSGDVHVGEAHELSCAALGYPLYDFTSSGLTHSWSGWIVSTVWHMLIPGAATRVDGAIFTDKNWGEIELHQPKQQRVEQQHAAAAAAAGTAEDGLADTTPSAIPPPPPDVTFRLFNAEEGASLGRVAFQVHVDGARLAPKGGVGLERLAFLQQQQQQQSRSSDRPPSPPPFSTAWKHYNPLTDADSAVQSQEAFDTSLLWHEGGKWPPAPPSLSDSQHYDYPRLPNGIPYPLSAAEASPASLREAIIACARAPMDRGLTPACQRVLFSCEPKPNRRDALFYWGGHALAVAFVVAVVLLPPLMAAWCWRGGGGASSKSGVGGDAAATAAVEVEGGSQIPLAKVIAVIIIAIYVGTLGRVLL